MSELKEAIAEYYTNKVPTEADRMWEFGELDNESIDRILNEHRTIKRIYQGTYKLSQFN